MIRTMSDTKAWTPDTTSFAARLWSVRRHLGLTQDALALMCGLRSQEISRWEAGTMPRNLAEVVDKIATATGVDRDWLMWGTDDAGLPTREYPVMPVAA